MRLERKAGTLGARLWSSESALQEWGAPEHSDGGPYSELCFRIVSLQDKDTHLGVVTTVPAREDKGTNSSR